MSANDPKRTTRLAQTRKRSEQIPDQSETGNKSIVVSHRTPQWPEEFSHILGQALRLLKRGEVPTPRHLGPALHVEEAFGVPCELQQDLV